MSAIQFLIPRVAANAIDFPAVRKAGQAAGIDHTWIEYSDHSVAQYGRTRITCSEKMAVFVIEAMRLIGSDASEHGKSELAIACAEGVASAFKAIDEERAKPSDDWPTRYFGTAPN